MYRHEKRPLPAEETFDGSHAYRLKLWPQIPDRFRTARILGACSRMTVGPVTANWFLSHTGLEAGDACALVAVLEDQGALERIELGHRPAGQPTLTRVPVSAVARLRERLAQRFPWKPAAVIAIVVGVSAALEHDLAASLGLLALNLPSLFG